MTTGKLIAFSLSVIIIGVVAFFGYLLPEMRLRRITRNQDAAYAACVAFVKAQDKYRQQDWDSDGVLEYAQTLRDLARADPVGIPHDLVDAAGAPGDVPPWNGYVFKVLTAQGPGAAGGARNYLVDGNMTLGYALVAVPAERNVSGRETFIINQNGTIFFTDVEVPIPAAFDPKAPGVWLTCYYGA